MAALENASIEEILSLMSQEVKYRMLRIIQGFLEGGTYTENDELPLPENLSKASVTIRDLSCLFPNRWFTDNIINFYCQFLSEVKYRHQKKYFTIYSTFFYNSLMKHFANTINFRNVQRVRSEDIFKKKLVIIPLNVGGVHWITLLLCHLDTLQAQLVEGSDGSQIKMYVPDYRKKVTKPYMVIFDSMGRKYEEIFSNMRKYIAMEYRRLYNQEINVARIPDHPTSTPQQDNNNDCGVFTVQNIAKSLQDIKKFENGVPNLSSWYPVNFIPYKRLELLQIIVRMAKKNDGK